MKWYIERLAELEKLEPRYSCCGDDCAVCPRFLASTEDELQETAEFWHRVGWRDHVVSNEKIRCKGCGTRGSCAFMILPCMREKNVEDCKNCGEYPCGKIVDMLRGSDIKEKQCAACCDDPKEWTMLKRAFYEKKKNLDL